VNVAVGVIGLQ